MKHYHFIRNHLKSFQAMTPQLFNKLLHRSSGYPKIISIHVHKAKILAWPLKTMRNHSYAYPTFLPVHPNCESTSTVFRAHKTGRFDADNYVMLVVAKLLQLHLLLNMGSPQVAYNRSQAPCWPNDPSMQHRNDHWPCVCGIWLGRQGRMWQYEWL